MYFNENGNAFSIIAFREQGVEQSSAGELLVF
jgi:hypothetical protein